MSETKSRASSLPVLRRVVRYMLHFYKLPFALVILCILVSAVATVGMSAFFRLWESFPPMLPDLSAHPLAAALLGGLFVGVGVGIVVRQGGSCGGDDALALVISKATGWRLSRAYLFTDLTVLLLSLSYIPLRRIAFSLVTVTVSSLIIDALQSPRLPLRRRRSEAS